MRKDSLDNCLLIERFEELMNEVEVEIHEKPYRIIYYKDRTIQLMDLEEERLELYPLNRLKYMEGLLRSKGCMMKQNWEAAKRIYAYHLNIVSSLGRDAWRVPRFDPLRGTQPKEDKMRIEEADWHVKRQMAEIEFRGKNQAEEEFTYEDQP